VVAAESRVAASAAAEAVALPPPLSTNPLLLDGRLVPLDPAPGWSGENALPFWWNRFFNGVISATTPGTCLRLPVRGTTVGLFYALDPGYGTFHVNLDGGTPEVVDCSVRGGYSYSMLGSDLPAAEHTVAIAVAKPVEKNGGPVKLGYLLVAGETHSTRAAAPQGTVDPAVSALIDFAPLAATEWEWSGPYGGAEKTTGPTADLETAFAPEVMPGPATSVAPEAAAAPVWRRGSGDGATLDFATLTTTGWSDRGVCYARTNVRRAAAGPAFLALRVDYFAKVWVNGAVVRVIAGGHGHPNTPILFPVEFKSGDNALLIKVHSGSRGNRFSLFVECEAQAR
jgi:hypothetical protein